MRKIFLFIVPLLFCVFSIKAQTTSAEENAALSLVSASKAKLGLSAEDLSNVMVSSTSYDNATGIRMVYLLQTYQGIPVFNQMLVLSYRDGKLLSQAGAFNHSLEKFAAGKSATPAVTAAAAVQSAISDRGLHASQMAIAISTKDNGRKAEFSNMGISRENITAQLMWTPVENSNEVRLSWHVYIVPKTTSDYWMVRVDAENNSILGMDNYTDYDNWGTPDVNGLVKYPGFAYGNTQNNAAEKNMFDFKQAEGPSTVTTATYRVVPFPAEAPSFPNGAHALRTDPWLAGSANATTLKWNTGAAATDYNYTRGNNVWAYQDRSNTNSGSVAASASSSTALPNLTFDFTPNYTVDPTQTTPVPNQQFNTTNLFYWNNIIHDVMYAYGFTETAFNFQDDNLGRGGAGNDHVNAEAQDGSGTNNANFSTPADGGSGRMQMYLWTGGSPNRDGDVDNGVIVHEFGHGISNRLTGGGTGACLGNAEQMGEGWSDYYALMFTQDWATATLNTGFNSPRGIGTYALFQAPSGLGIRTQKYCTDFTVNNKVYLASLPAGPHPRGEIWCATLWDMTWNIINQVGTINSNIYNVAGGGGNVIAMRLVTEGMKLQQCNPGFISGRNAILQADQNLYGGLYSCAIWEAFRRRGMGAFASEGSTNSVTDQVPDFTPPLTLGATVSATTIPEGSNLTYTNSLTTCSAVSGYTLRDTLPTNVTYVSGGTYDAPNRVVSFAVNQAAGTTNYPFIVQVNNGSYFPPVTLFTEPVATASIPAAWTVTTPAGNPWTVSTTVSNSAPNSFFVQNMAVAGDQRLATTNSYAIPLNSYPELSFWHRWNTEDGWDGGVVEISTNGGATWSDVGASNFTLNGYNGALGAAPTNALTGRAAFTGLQATFINTKVNLAAYNGQTIMLRFRFGSDDNTAAPTNPTGWWVDDISLSYKPAVNMRTSLFNASNVRVSFKDMITEITQLVNCAPTITQQPVSAVTCAGSSVTYTCVGSATGGVTYQWQLSTTGIAGAYNNLANGAPYSGVTTSTLTVNPTAVGMNGYYYRCIVTGGCAPNATSNPAQLSVAAGSTAGTTAPANTNVCGTTNSGVITVSGYNGNVVRWESATNIAGPWTAIANTTNTYTFNNVAQTTYFRAVTQFGTCTEANSSIATVTFAAALPISIIADPGTTVCAGDPTRLTVMEGIASSGTIQTTFTNNNAFGLVIFNFRNNNAFPVTITGIESIASTSGPSTASLYYKTTAIAGAPGAISVANGWNLANTGSYTAVANTTTNVPQVFLSGLNSLVIPAGATYGLAVESKTAANVGNLRYSTVAAGTYTISAGGCDIITGTGIGYAGDIAPAVLANTPRGFIGKVSFSGGGLTPIPGGTYLWTPAAGLSSTTSNPVAASPMVTTTYTVNHNNGAGCIRQANITITVNQRPTVITQPVNATTCSGSSATFTVAGTGTALTYQWQVSTTGCAGTFTNIVAGAPYSGETTATLTVNPATVAMNGYAYRCVLSGTCSPVNNANISGCAVLNVNPLPAVTVTPASGCGGVAGINGLLLTAAGANTYTWAPFNGLYTNATATTAYTGGNTPTVYAAPTAYTAYTVTGTNTTTGCSNTATALINYTPPAPNIVPSSVSMCLGDPAVKLKSSTATSTTVAFNSGAISVAIPDNSQAGASHNIIVSGIPANATVTGMRAKMTIPHTFIGDLVIALKAPNNNVLNLDFFLSNTFGGVTTGFSNTIFTSAAGAPAVSTGTNPYSSSFRADGQIAATGNGPAAPTGYTANMANYAALISSLTPANVNGTYTLAMYDGGAIDVGTLTNWEIEFTYVQGVPATPAVWTPAAGLFSDAAATVPYVAGTAVDSVWTRPTPAGVYPYQATVQSLPIPPATVNTPMAGGNGNNLVAFNVRNNNGYPVTLNSISSNAFGSGAVVSRVFYKAAPIAGNPGAISAANGWNQFGTANNTVTANTLNQLMTGLTLVIPPGTTYGIALDFTGATVPAYTNGTGTIVAYSTGGVDVITDGNVGWGGPAAPGTPANNPRNFNGAVTFTASVTPCTSAPRTVVVTVNQPTTLNAALPANQTICTDKVATFTATVTAGTGPHSYQWQVSTNGGGTYTNVANGGVYSGATSATLTVTAPPVTMSGYLYRCVVTGAAPCAAQTSRAATLTVNPLPVIVLTASPYTSLFPGLRTTISSNVTPNPAATYTWLRNGVVLTGATTGSVNVDVDGLGDYQLRVTDVNGCNNSSNIVTIKDSASGRCFIYPNPNSGQFQVRYYSVANNVLPRGIVVYDSKGDRVLSQNYTIGRPYDRMDVDLRAKGKGLYWVEIVDRNGNRLTMCRVVIQ